MFAHYSRFLITEEEASPPPVYPASNARRFFGEIPQQPDPNDTLNHYRLVDHLRHLLADDPDLRARGLYGGLNLWFARNTEKLLEVVSEARDDQNLTHVHLEIVRALDYLDRSSFSHADVPSGTPFLIDPLAGQVGLLTFDQQQPGFLSHIEKHLSGLVESPGAIAAQQSRTRRMQPNSRRDHRLA